MRNIATRHRSKKCRCKNIISDHNPPNPILPPNTVEGSEDETHLEPEPLNLAQPRRAEERKKEVPQTPPRSGRQPAYDGERDDQLVARVNALGVDVPARAVTPTDSLHLVISCDLTVQVHLVDGEINIADTSDASLILDAAAEIHSQGAQDTNLPTCRLIRSTLQTVESDSDRRSTGTTSP
jgi:hypothetical protein